MYLIWFRSHNRYDSCKITELESLVETFGQERGVLWKYDEEHISGETNDTAECRAERLHGRNKKYQGEIFVKGHFENEETCKNIISRSILTKGIVEVWAEGECYDDVLKQLLSKTHLFEKYLTNKKWSFRFASFRKTLSQEEKIQKMNHFQILFKDYNSVDLRNPDVQIALFEEYENRNTNVLKKVYFGRCIALRNDYSYSTQTAPNGKADMNENEQVCETNKSAHKIWWNKYTLARRPVLAPTTTDNELAFIMCNIGKVKKGSIVMDPFVGSGGLLISATVCNAMCIGTDIDIRLLRGHRLSYLNKNMSHTSTKKHIFQNFLHYNLIKPGIIRSDVSNPVWQFFRRPWVDAIITDPPYGNRAAVRTSVKKRKENNEKHSGEANNTDDINMTYTNGSVHKKTDGYDCNAAIKDLFTIASNVLVDNGMLVFLYPVQLGTENESISFLKHPDFYLNSYDLESLTSTTGRLIVSMQRKERN